VTAANDLAAPRDRQDVISCATLAEQSLIEGRWLKSDVTWIWVGSFTPNMREADDGACAAPSLPSIRSPRSRKAAI